MAHIIHTLPELTLRETGGESPKKSPAKRGHRAIPFEVICAMREEFSLAQSRSVAEIAERYDISYSYAWLILNMEARVKE